jgi:hypothetical protein
MNETNRVEALNEKVTTTTAFPSWAALVAACRGGYVPTLTPRVGRAAYLQAENKARRALVRALKAEGLRVWLG